MKLQRTSFPQNESGFTLQLFPYWQDTEAGFVSLFLGNPQGSTGTQSIKRFAREKEVSRGAMDRQGFALPSHVIRPQVAVSNRSPAFVRRQQRSVVKGSIMSLLSQRVADGQTDHTTHLTCTIQVRTESKVELYSLILQALS